MLFFFYLLEEMWCDMMVFCELVKIEWVLDVRVVVGEEFMEIEWEMYEYVYLV